MSAARHRGIGALADGASVVLVLLDLELSVSPDAARALAVLLSTCADIAEAHKDDDEREPTSADRGLA